MSSKRPERRRSSLAGLSPVNPPAPPAAEPQDPAPAPAAPSTTPAQVPARKASSRESDLARLGLRLSPSEYTAAKAAYLADWQTVRQADMFRKWVGAALAAHAARSVNERERLATTVSEGRAVNDARTFDVDVDVLERMRAAIGEDNAAGRWPSESAWARDAIAAAVDDARERAGGQLPTPPARLPNRLR